MIDRLAYHSRHTYKSNRDPVQAGLSRRSAIKRKDQRSQSAYQSIFQECTTAGDHPYDVRWIPFIDFETEEQQEQEKGGENEGEGCGQNGSFDEQGTTEGEPESESKMAIFLSKVGITLADGIPGFSNVVPEGTSQAGLGLDRRSRLTTLPLGGPRYLS
jgi:hypothetical protein